jgi:hypothetical protein
MILENMKKFRLYFFAAFLLTANTFIFSSQQSKEIQQQSRRLQRLLKEYQEKDPAEKTLMQDPVFENAYEFGKVKYEELWQLIQANKSLDDGERVIYRQGDITYILYKKHKVIESLGFGYKILIKSSGRIDHFNT